MEPVAQKDTSRTEFIAAIAHFVDGNVDPALGEEIVGEEKSHDGPFNMIRRFQKHVVEIEVDVEVIDGRTGNEGTALQ